MTYPEQLNTNEWQNKRKLILERDNNKCTICKNENLLKNCSYGYIYNIEPTKNPHLEKYILNYYLINSAISGLIYIDESQKEKLILNGLIYAKKNITGNNSLVAIRRPTIHEKEIFSKYNANLISTIEQDPFDIENILKLQFEKESIKQRELLEVSDFNRGFDFIFTNGLHIHHKYYVKNLLAWEYPNDALVTLCFDCHENLHKNQTITVYDSNSFLVEEYKRCKRCHGAGVFPEYSHVQSGICFKCSGSRFEL